MWSAIADEAQVHPSIHKVAQPTLPELRQCRGHRLAHGVAT